MGELTREQVLMSVISGRGPAYLRGVDLSSVNLANAGWLTEADLRQANLSGANLSKANLKDAKLERANLHESNLTGTILERAELLESKLNGVVAVMANLRGANLQSARLVGANLTKANLEGANLKGADLEGANLEGANLGNANLDLANLKLANLKGANMKGASIVGIIVEGTQMSVNGQAPACGFAGSIHNLQLIDLIQLASMSRSSLLIRVESGRDLGVMHIRSGRITHAQTGTLRGEKALFEILHWENGRFETLLLPKDTPTSIDKPLEHLIVEAMRMKDEKRISEQRKKRIGESVSG